MCPFIISIYLGPPSTSPQKKRQTVKSSVCNLGLERRHDDEIDLVLVTLPLLPPDMLNSLLKKFTFMFSLSAPPIFSTKTSKCVCAENKSTPDTIDSLEAQPPNVGRLNSTSEWLQSSPDNDSDQDNNQFLLNANDFLNDLSESDDSSISNDDFKTLS